MTKLTLDLQTSAKVLGTTPDGWASYDIHHIHPRELGGNNDFDNLVPVLREVHQSEFNEFWRNW
jgi:filamentous hemagglutinin